MQIEITDNEIEETEKLLLPNGLTFDKERRDFIKDLTTLDLQAVPGSGKTTALLSKLIILGNKLPFDNGSGILVISHTNAAVDEIKKRITSFAPKLFEYPNFVGTVQSFVDTFLAIPFYTNELKHRPYRIDDEIFNELCERKFKYGNDKFLYMLKGKNSELAETWLKSLRLNSNNEITMSTKLPGKDTPSYKGLYAFKESCINQGVFTYSEAYSLAQLFIKKYPIIKNLLKKRFSFVFIDEMQDIEEDKYELLENLFYEPNNNDLCFQRIGDINQSIYSQGTENKSCVWTFRNKKLQICGSQRLNPQIANVVQRFSIEKQIIVGRRKNPDNSEINIKPHLIVYEKTSIRKVIQKFIEIIKELKDTNILLQSNNEKYIVTGWRKIIENKTEDKYCISDYWQDFGIENVKNKIDFNTLDAYLKYFDTTYFTLESIRKNILNALIKILRLENVRDSDNHLFTKRTMIDFIKDSKDTLYEDFKLNLFKWCTGIINNDSSVIQGIKNYIPDFLKLFNSEYKNSRSFVETTRGELVPVQTEKQNNIVYNNDIKVNIQTVHSVKGQTCTGLLYLETFNGKAKSQKIYESQKLSESICGTDFSDLPNQSDYIKTAAKMMYVGFSRPTHLLCFAVQKDRFDEYLSTINTEEWEIVNI